MRHKELAAVRIRYGYQRLHILLRREGWTVNHKRTDRLSRDEGLSIRPKVPRRKRAWRYRQSRPEAGRTRSGPWTWSLRARLRLMADQLFDGRRAGS